MDNELVEILEDLKDKLVEFQSGVELIFPDEIAENKSIVEMCNQVIKNELEN